MKYCLAQINPIVGDVEGNAKKIADIISSFRDKVDLIVFPEMVITGYPPHDLLLNKNFISDTELALANLVKEVSGCNVILGTIRQLGQKIFNTAVFIDSDGKIEYRDKTLLPNYDVFNESRYFTPGSNITPIELKLKNRKIKIGLQVCEDLWDSNYDLNITKILVENGAELVINISASHFYINKNEERHTIVKSKVDKHKVPFMYCNMVGGQDELVFDGQSFALDSSGSVIALGASFKEDLILGDLNIVENLEIYKKSIDEQIYLALSLGLKDYFSKTSHSTAIIGLSGGIDSALTCAIASDALGPENIYGIAMPSKFSSSHSISDAEILADNLGINFKTISIKNINKQFLEDLSPVFLNTKPGIAEENLQARIRGNLLMSIANKQNSLLINTSNKTESALGYSTLYGDMCGAIALINDLNKSQVYSLAKWINKVSPKGIIPEGSITKAPSAELSPGQVDPFDYNLVSPLVESIIDVNEADSESILLQELHSSLYSDLVNKIQCSEHKRSQAAPGIRISKKAFGIGRRYPIVNRYKN